MATEIDPGSLVAKALLSDRRLGTAVFEIEERNGNIRLSGTVSSEGLSAAAEELARQQAGVVDVINNIISA